MSKTICLRPAAMADAEILLLWRNDPLTRKQFRNTEPVERVAHVVWLEKTLSGQISGRTLVIAACEGVPVGAVRSDISEDGGFYEIYYTIAPEERGKGFGVLLVTQFVSQHLQGKKIRLEIKKGNVASEKIAQALGLSVYKESSLSKVGDLLIWQ